MNLNLVIGNPAQLLHGYLPSHRFDRSGGSIGSGACDWPLLDRRRTVHRNHCEIRFMEGHFCVIDHSGKTYINGHDRPLRPHAAVCLNDGDSLQIGAYQIIAHVLAPGTAEEHPPHLSQCSLDELLNGLRDDQHDWPGETLPLLPIQQQLPASCPEFERLCRPFGLPEEQDPLLALQMPIAPARDVLDLPRSAHSDASFLQPSPGTDRSPVNLPPVRGFARLTSNLRFAALLVCVTLGGCTTLGKVGQVIMNPSIPVGGPDEQPSRYSLSLHASDRVNLRRISPGTAPHGSTDLAHSPYTVNLRAGSHLELTDKLQGLLNHLYEVAPAQSLLAAEEAPPAQMSPVEPSLLGNYDDPGVSLSTPEYSAAPEQIATPIAFKVLQLTDDSLLLNASAQALAHDLKKNLGSTYLRHDDYLLQPGQFKFIHLRPLEEDTRYLAVIADYNSTDVTQWKQILRIEPKGRQYALLVQLDETRVGLIGEHR